MVARQRCAGRTLRVRDTRACQRGFSLLELVIVIVLVSVLMAIAIERMLVIKAQAERAALDQVVGSIRSGLTIRLAELMIRGRLAEAPALAGSNPMKVLAETPQNYLGELRDPDPAALQPGSWYFDSRNGALCYLVENVEYFETALVPARARFRIEPVYEDMNRNGRYDAGIDSLHGLRLAALEPYAWNLRFVWPDWPWRRATRARPEGRG